MMQTTIPFAGFYESIWSGELDSVEEREIENLEEDWPTLEIDQIADVVREHVDYQGAREYIAKAYVDVFAFQLEDQLGVDIKLAYTLIDSPREYNFTTDRLFCEVSPEDVFAVYMRVGTELLRATAKERFTSRSGFASFYSANIDDWGPLDTWDHNQVGTLFEAATQLLDDPEDFNMAQLGGMEEVADTAFSENLDWVSTTRDLQHLVDIQNGVAEEDARKFPKGNTSDTAAYVREFETRNHLKQAGPVGTQNDTY